MALNFIFAEYLNETGCVSLRLENNGEVGAPFIFRTFEDIKGMQVDADTVVVVPSIRCGLHEVELPWIGETKARAAIPFALEEQLAQKISTLQFAFDRAYHSNNHYLVAVIDKDYLVHLMTTLDHHGIAFNEITLAWFALQPYESCITSSCILVRDEALKGALSFDLARNYLDQLIENSKVLTFSDTSSEWIQPSYTAIDSPFLVWAAKRLQRAPRINLCQGELKHGQSQQGFNRMWAIGAITTFTLWLLTVLVMNVVNIVRLNHEINQVDKDIAIVYRQFFPEAQQIISPRFRITQLLNKGHTSDSESLLWPLLDRLDKVVHLKEVTIEQLDYKNQVLSLTLKSRDFNMLENLVKQLKQEQVKVDQTQAVSHEQYVTAVMELRL